MAESTEPESAAELPASPAAARVVARVIDPSVREDGGGAPVLILHTAEARARLRQSLGPDLSGAGHPVRERLLARARAALDAPAVVPGSEPPPAPLPVAAERISPPPEEPGFDSLSEPADDLDLIGAPERERSPRPAQATAPLSPSAALLLGTSLGVGGLAALFAVLMQLWPHPALQLQMQPPLAQAVPAPTAPEAAPSVVGLAAPLELAAPPVVPLVKHEPRKPHATPPWRLRDSVGDPGLRKLSGSIGNAPFLSALSGAGVGRREAYRVLNAFTGVKNLNRCRPRDTWSALLDASGKLVAFEYSSGEDDIYQAREEKPGQLVARQLDLQIERQRAEGVIVVHGSFELSAQRAGFEPGLSDVVNKALAGHTSTSAMKDGDILRLVAQEVTMLGDFDRYAGVEALEYRTPGAEPLRIYYHSSNRARAYVDARGRTFGKSRWARPVAGYGVSSRYNPKRFHPILKRIKPHNGTDFGAPIGTPIQAAASGVVSFVGSAGPNGRMVRLSHTGGYETSYSHMSRFAKGLSAGARVEQKQVIGYVGSTGRSTGPHLHFSAKRQGQFIDPESLNLDGLLRIPLGDRAGFQALRERYDQVLDALSIPLPPSTATAALTTAPTAPAPGEAEPAEDVSLE